MQDRNLKSETLPTKRLFFALLPDTQTRARLAELQAGIQGRKLPRENFHLTLMFLGNQSESCIPRLKAFIDQLDFSAFNLRIDKRGFFPRVKISWVGSSEHHPELARLHTAVRNYCAQNLGLAHDIKRPFRPHITLARNALPTEIPLPPPFVWHVNRLALMESLISREKSQSAVYRILHDKQA